MSILKLPNKKSKRNKRTLTPTQNCKEMQNTPRSNNACGKMYLQ